MTASTLSPPATLPQPRSQSGCEHLLALPVPVKVDERGQVWLEMSSAGGLRLWLEHFQSLCLLAPAIPIGDKASRDKVARVKSQYLQWTPLADFPERERLSVVPLPWAYTRLEAWRRKREVQETIRRHLRTSRYVQCCIGGWTGDWAGLAAEEALRLGKPYVVHIDSIGDRIVRADAAELPWPRRIARNITAHRMRRWHNRLARGAAAVLCNGGATFEVLRPVSEKAVLINNGPLREVDVISDEAADQKIAGITADTDRPLKLLYVGRTMTIKGPTEWVEALAAARDQGVKFTATWLGDGPQQAELRAAVERAGLAEQVHLGGFVDRGTAMKAMHEADLFVFCHKIPESPRNVVEAAASACASVGYDDAYVAEGLGDGARLTPRGDPLALAKALVHLNQNRHEIADMTRAAHHASRRFTGPAAFKIRADLIRQAIDPIQA